MLPSQQPRFGAEPQDRAQDGKPVAETWTWFALMDEASGLSAAVSPPCPITPIQEDKPVPSAARASGKGKDEEKEEEEEERESDKERGQRAGQRGRRRRMEREDPFLTLLKEDIKYQREADERRAAETRERANRFSALLERLAEKWHNCSIEQVVVFLMLYCYIVKKNRHYEQMV